MKKLLFILFTINCFAQAPNIEWQKSFGGSNYDFGRSVAQTNDGGFIIAGNTNSINGNITQSFGNTDILIVKVNSTGIIEWQKTYGGLNNEFINTIKQTNDSGYILTGYSNSNNGTYSTNHGGNDYLILKLNNTGDLVWQKNYGGTNDEYSLDIIQTNEGGYIAFGRTDSSNGDVIGNHSSVDFWLLKLDSNGVIEWQKTYGGSGTDIAEKIKQTNDGGYILIGYTNSANGDVSFNNGANDIWVIKINSIGIIEWDKCIGGLSSEYGYGVIQTNDFGYLISGIGIGIGNLLITKLNSFGILEWQNIIDGNGSDNNYSVENDSNGSAVIIGFSDSTNNNFTSNHGGFDIWVTKISATGNILWQKLLGGTNNDFAYSVQKTADDGYIIAGNTSSSNGDVTQNYGLSDFWLVKLYPDQLSNSTFQENNITIYPNPTANLLNIQLQNYAIIDKLFITDLTGKIILNPLENTSQIDTQNLSNGMYIIQAFSGENKYQSKFIKQ